MCLNILSNKKMQIKKLLARALAALAAVVCTPPHSLC